MKITKERLKEIIREEVEKLDEATAYDILTPFYGRILDAVVSLVRKNHTAPPENIKSHQSKRSGFAFVEFDIVDRADIYNHVWVQIMEPGPARGGNSKNAMLASVKMDGGFRHARGGLKVDFHYKFTDDEKVVVRGLADHILAQLS